VPPVALAPVAPPQGGMDGVAVPPPSEAQPAFAGSVRAGPRGHDAGGARALPTVIRRGAPSRGESESAVAAPPEPRTEPAAARRATEPLQTERSFNQL
jgi:hypothetical protein